MKRHSIHSLLAACLMTLVTGLALVSCSQDEAPDTPALVPEGSPVTVSLTLSTRAEETAGKDPYYDYPDGEIAADLINSWWVAICEVNGGKPGKVVKIVPRDAAETDPIKSDIVSVELSAPAEYYFFAFANLTQTDLTAATGLVFEEEKVPSLSSSSQNSHNSQFSNLSETDFQSLTWDNISTRLGKLNSSETGAQVPMSGMKRVQVTRHVNQKYSIEMVRMLAKIRFEFTNNTSSDEITVNSITMNPFIDGGKLNLFPRYDTSSWQPKIGKEWGKDGVAIDPNCAYSEKTFYAGRKVKKGATDATTFTRYIREMLSESNDPSGLFHLGFDISRDGKNVSGLYAYMDESFDYVNRNDYIIIPVRFTDWVVKFNLRFYPPIGGYPAIIKDDPAQYRIEFGTPGRFEIYVEVGKYNPDDPEAPIMLAKDKYKFKIELLEGESFLEEGLNQYDPEQMIYGDIRSGTAGKGTVKALFTLLEADGKTERLPVKRLYITRK